MVAEVGNGAIQRSPFVLLPSCCSLDRLAALGNGSADEALGGDEDEGGGDATTTAFAIQPVQTQVFEAVQNLRY